MQITIYSGFKKRPNSTKQPTAGTNVTVTLKEATSIENPTFILAGGLSSYENITAVLWDGRYYFVTDVVSRHNGITELSCSIDRLATFKTDILASSQMIERSAVGYDQSLIDSYCDMQADTYIESWKSGNIFSRDGKYGYVAVSVISDLPATEAGGTTGVYYCDPFPATESGGGMSYSAQDLIKKIWDGTFIGSLMDVVTDSQHALLRAVYIPCFDVSDLKTIIVDSSTTPVTYAAYATTNASPVHLSTRDFPDIVMCRPSFHATRLPYIQTFTCDLSTLKHYNNYDWANREPYSVWNLYLPYYGVVQISPDDYIGSTNATTMVIDVVFDFTTGDLEYVRKKRQVVGGVTTDYIMATYRTCIGVNIPLSQITGTPDKFASTLLNAGVTVAAGAVTGGVGGAIGFGAAALANTAAAGMQKNASTAGGFGASGCSIAAAEGRQIELTQIGHYLNNLPSNHAASVGGPTMMVDTLSSYTGFLKTTMASVECSGTQADKDFINSALDAGIFIE